MNVHGKLVTSIEYKTYHGSRVAQLMSTQALPCLYSRSCDNEAQAEDEQSDDQHGGKVMFAKDIVAECLRSETLRIVSVRMSFLSMHSSDLRPMMVVEGLPRKIARAMAQNKATAL